MCCQRIIFLIFPQPRSAWMGIDVNRCLMWLIRFHVQAAPIPEGQKIPFQLKGLRVNVLYHEAVYA